MKRARFELFPILPTNYRHEHLRRNERRYLSEKVTLPPEILKNRPILCSDGDKFITSVFPKYPVFYDENMFNEKLVDEILNVKAIQEEIRRLELEENGGKMENSMNDPRSLYISEDIEQMMPVNTFEDFNQFKTELPDLEDIGKPALQMVGTGVLSKSWDAVKFDLP